MSEPPRSHTGLFDTLYLGVGACEITHAPLLLWLSFFFLQCVALFLFLLLIIDDTAPCQAVWGRVCVVLTLAPLFRVGNDHRATDKSVKCLSGRALRLLQLVFGVLICP